MDRYSTYAVLSLAVTCAVGCGPPETFDRQKMLTDTVDRVIAPTHETLGGEAEALNTAVDDLCADDASESELEEARTSWRNLQEPLKHIQAWSFNMSPYRGKSFDLSVYKIDKEPAWGDNIEAVIAAGDARYRKDRRADGDEEPDKPFPDGDTTIDADFIAAQNYLRRAKGYPAVEYLLFGSPDEDTSTLEAYQADGEGAERRCAYLKTASSHAKGKIDGYVEAWNRDGGDFAGMFDSEAPDDMDWTTVQDSINAMVSQMVFVTKQRLSREMLGGPLGQHGDDPRVPDSESSPYAGASLDQAEALLTGVENLYRGGDGKSLADLTAFRKQSVADLIDERFAAARQALEDVPAPLSEAVENDRAKVEAAQKAIDKLVQAIEADLKTTLGASTTRVVVDND